MTNPDLLSAFVDLLVERLARRISPGSVPGEKTLWSVKEAAANVGCSVSSLRGMITSGSLPQRVIRRFGRRLLLDRKEFLKWVESH